MSFTFFRSLLVIGSFVIISTHAAESAADQTAPDKAPKPLRILVLGGTGFTGPFQVRYALSRGQT